MEEDPMLRRERFAIKLRQTKKRAIIKDKRMKLTKSKADSMINTQTGTSLSELSYSLLRQSAPV